MKPRPLLVYNHDAKGEVESSEVRATGTADMEHNLYGGHSFALVPTRAFQSFSMTEPTLWMYR